MVYIARIIAVVGATALTAGLGAGCSSLSDMTAAPTQVLAVNTNPHGARCTAMRDGATLATIATPNKLTIAQRGGDVTLKCAHPEYETTVVQIPAAPRTAGVGDMLAAGSASQYPQDVTVPMRPIGSTPPSRAPRKKAAAAKKPTAAKAQASNQAATPAAPQSGAVQKKAAAKPKPAAS